MKLFPCIIISVLVILFSIYQYTFAFPSAIFPLLPSEWYYKPTPAEGVVLGLIVVKVLAIRLASVVGILPIPYHLNDLFLRGKRNIPDEIRIKNLTLPQKRTLRSAMFLQNPSTLVSRRKDDRKSYHLDEKELQAVIHIFRSLERLNTRGCFLKTLCTISSRISRGQNFFEEDEKIIFTITFLSSWEKYMKNKKRAMSTVMDAYDAALMTGSKFNEAGCQQTYSNCPLTDETLQEESKFIFHKL